MSSIVYIYGTNAWRTRDKWVPWEKPVDPNTPEEPENPGTNLGLGSQALGTTRLGGATV